MGIVSLFNPFSSQHHAIGDFKRLTTTQKIITIALTAIASFFTVFIGGAAVFRTLTNRFVSVQKDSNFLPQPVTTIEADQKKASLPQPVTTIESDQLVPSLPQPVTTIESDQLVPSLPQSTPPPPTTTRTIEAHELNPTVVSVKKAERFQIIDDAQRALIYQSAPRYSYDAMVKTISSFGGSASVVDLIIEVDPSAKCGVMICANSGLPCGKVRTEGGTQEMLGATTQEESIMANILLTQFGEDVKTHKEFMENAFDGVWGLIGRSTMTYQGIDFTTTTNAADYGQVYVLSDCEMGVIGGDKKLIAGRKNQVSLIFADSVNANQEMGFPGGTMKRTLNQKASRDYGFFLECIETKLRAALDAMVGQGNTHAIIGRLSCGIYAPKEWKGNVNEDFDNLLPKILNEKVGPKGEIRRSYFKEVIMPHISRT